MTKSLFITALAICALFSSCGKKKKTDAATPEPTIYNTWQLSASKKIAEVVIDTDSTDVYQNTKIKVEEGKVTLINECIAGAIIEQYTDEVTATITETSIALAEPLDAQATDSKIKCVAASFSNSQKNIYTIRNSLLHVFLNGQNEESVLSKVL